MLMPQAPSKTSQWAGHTHNFTLLLLSWLGKRVEKGDGDAAGTTAALPVLLGADPGPNLIVNSVWGAEGKFKAVSNIVFRKMSLWKGIWGEWILCSGDRMGHLTMHLQDKTIIPKGGLGESVCGQCGRRGYAARGRICPHGFLVLLSRLGSDFTVPALLLLGNVCPVGALIPGQVFP